MQEFFKVFHSEKINLKIYDLKTDTNFLDNLIHRVSVISDFNDVEEYTSILNVFEQSLLFKKLA